MKRVLWLVMIASFAGMAYAQQPAPTAKLPSASGFGFSNTVTVGYAYNRTDYNLPDAQGFNGVAGSYSRKFTKHFDVTVDLEYTRNGNADQVSASGRKVPYNAHDFGYRIGPRYDIITGGKIVPYIHFLAGGSSTVIQYPGTRQNNFGGTSGNNFGFSWAGGGGVEGYFKPRWGVIFEYDVVHRPIDPHGAIWQRVTAGLAYRF